MRLHRYVGPWIDLKWRLSEFIAWYQDIIVNSFYSVSIWILKMKLKEVGRSVCVCVCLHARLRAHPASREQGTTRVVSVWNRAICLKTVKRFSVHQQIWNHQICGSPLGLIRRRGILTKASLFFKLCRAAMKSINKQINRRSSKFINVSSIFFWRCHENAGTFQDRHRDTDEKNVFFPITGSA